MINDNKTNDGRFDWMHGQPQSVIDANLRGYYVIKTTDLNKDGIPDIKYPKCDFSSTFLGQGAYLAFLCLVVVVENGIGRLEIVECVARYASRGLNSFTCLIEDGNPTKKYLREITMVEIPSDGLFRIMPPGFKV